MMPNIWSCIPTNEKGNEHTQGVSRQAGFVQPPTDFELHLPPCLWRSAHRFVPRAPASAFQETPTTIPYAPPECGNPRGVRQGEMRVGGERRYPLFRLVTGRHKVVTAPSRSCLGLSRKGRG